MEQLAEKIKQQQHRLKKQNVFYKSNNTLTAVRRKEWKNEKKNMKFFVTDLFCGRKPRIERFTFFFSYYFAICARQVLAVAAHAFSI